MSYERQKRLVQRLLDKTRAGELDWQESALADAFQISFSKYSLTIRRAETERNIVYQIEIFDSFGNNTEFFDDEELIKEADPVVKNWFNIMKEIFETAKRKVVGADEALDSILEEIG